MEAETAQHLETERKGERFTLIEPPFTPQEPTSPNRRLVLILGLVAALGAGAAVVALLETLDGSIRGRSDLLRLLATPPLATIPVMLTYLDHVAQRRRRIALAWSAVGSVVVAAVLVHLLYRPLDIPWLGALRRLGIVI
jgi:hypothetical protein